MLLEEIFLCLWFVGMVLITVMNYLHHRNDKQSSIDRILSACDDKRGERAA